MPLPPITETGDLESGVHRAKLDEVLTRFGRSSGTRRVVADRLERIYSTAMATGDVARFVVFGSFVTTKPNPNDVDVFLLMNDTFDVGALTGEARLLFNHSAADTYFGASVFWLRRTAAFGGEQAMIEYWQVKRDGTLRGIVEIVGGAA